MKVAIPYASEPRADTGLTNTQMGIWLFLASEVMLFGGLFSAYAFIRTAAPQWPHGRETLSLGIAGLNTVFLLCCSWFAWRSSLAPDRRRRGIPSSGAPAFRFMERSEPWFTVVFAAWFLLLKSIEWHGHVAHGLLPSSSAFFALYYTLTGVHALHVVGGAIASVWAALGAPRAEPAQTRERFRALALYWSFVDIAWIVIVVLMYL